MHFKCLTTSFSGEFTSSLPQASKNLRTFIGLTFIVLSLGACGSKQNSTNANLKWGVHQSGLSANLLNLLPGQSVEICGDTPEQTANSIDAIKKWSSVIQRWGHFTINPCNRGSTLVIYVQGSNEWGSNQFTSNPGYIHVQSQSSGDMQKALLLHEVGHSWGLCDQYTDANSARCSYNRSPSQDDSEVMGTTMESKTALTKGDLTGIHAVADADTPANHAWKSYIATN